MSSEQTAAPGGDDSARTTGSLPFDISKAHHARMYDYLLGGKDNISQVVPGFPYSDRTATIQARHSNFSKTTSCAVRHPFSPCMGFMSGFSGGHS
ncbi:MAG TPA: SAM-dependent methyltransferase [Trebonia sp.]|nr:SAM-dependent methyltransferase [Trebonia sp.]